MGIVFAIAVMKINLGESRIYLRPIFWMMDPKDAVVNLKSYREVATIKRDPLELITPQDAIGFELAPQIENDEDPKDAVLDLKWYPFFKVRVMKKDPSQDAVGLNPSIGKIENTMNAKDAVEDLKWNPLLKGAALKRNPNIEKIKTYKDPKNAVEDLKWNPFFEVRVMKRDLSQDAVVLNPSILKIKNNEDPKDAVGDLKWNPFFKVAALKRNPSQDAVGLKMDAVFFKLVPSQDSVGLKLVPSQDVVGLKLVPSQEADNLKLILAEDAQYGVGLRIVPPKNMPLQKSLQLVHAWNLVPSYRVLPLDLVPPQDAVGFELIAHLENEEELKDAVVDLELGPFPEVGKIKRDPSQIDIGKDVHSQISHL